MARCVGGLGHRRIHRARTFYLCPRGGHSGLVPDDYSGQALLSRIWSDSLRDLFVLTHGFRAFDDNSCPFLSRATISVALLFYFLAKDKQSWPLWILTGLATGISFCVRPIETTFLLLPLGVATVVPVFTKKTRVARPVLGLLIGCLLPLALFFLYNFLITGDALFPPRFSAEGPAQTLMRGSLWNRFGANTSYNVFMLAIWFLGPLGILLIGFGLLADKFTRLLSLGVGAMLAAGLFHDNQGLHVVGPIHYSECVVPLIIIAVYGLVGIKEKLRRRKISFLIPASILVCVLVLGLGIFNFWQCQALNRQALIQNYVYGFIENSLQEKKVDKALILAPQFGSLWVANDYFRSIGSWVFEWRRAKPDLSDKTLILHDLPNVEEKLRAAILRPPVFPTCGTLSRPPILN